MDTFKKKKKKEQYSIDTLLTGNRERSASVFDEEERKRRIQRVKERAAQTREAIDDVRERYSSRVSMDGRRSAGITDEERQRRIDRVKSVSANTGSFVTPGTRRDTESSDGGLFSRRNGDFGGFSISSLLSSIADRGADNQLKVENNDSERQRRLERTKQYKTPQEKKEEERAGADSVPVTTTENTEKTKAVKDTEKDNKDTTPSQVLPTPKADTAPTLVPPSEPTQTPQVGRTPAPAASDLPMGVKPKVVASSGATPVEQSLEVPYKEEQPATMLEMDSDKPLYIREREAQEQAAADIEKQQHQLGNTGYKETLNPDSPMYDEEAGAELAQKAADDEFHNAAKRRDDYNQQQKEKQDEWLGVAEPEKPAEPVETLYDTTGDKPPVVKHREAAEKAELAGVEPLDVSVSTLGKNTNAYSRKLHDRPNYTPEQKLFMASKVVERTSDVVDEHFYTASERKADEEKRLNRRTDEFKALDLNVLKLLDKASDPDGEEYKKLLEMGYGENDIKDFRRLYKRYGLTYFYESRYSMLSESELELLGEMYTASINLEYADEYTSSKQIDFNRKKYLEGSGYFYDKGYSQQELLVFLDMYGRNKNEYAMNELTTSVETLADEHPVLGTVGRVGAGLISPIFSTAGSLDNYGKAAVNRTVGYKPALDANNPLYFLDKSVAAYDQRMIENLGEDTVGATAYKVGTNVTDNLLPALIGGPYVGAGYNALRAFNSAVISGSEKGLKPEQVLVDGLVTAGLEFAFEKVSLSNASFMQKSTGVKSIKTFLSDLGKDFIGEGSEEALTEIANIVYDTVVHGDKSDYQYLVNYYMSEGMSLENARIQAASDLGKQVIESGVLGGISGGVTSVGNSAYGAAAERASDYYIGKEIKKSGMQGEVIKNAKATPETTAAHKKATKLEKQLSAGKKVSNTGLAKTLRGTAEYTGGKDVQAVGQFEGAESSAELEKMYQNELGKITEEVELGFMKPGTAESKIEALENDYQKSKIAMSERFARSEYIRDVKTSLSEAQQFEIKHPDIKTDSGTATVNKIVDIKDGKFTVETTEKTGRRTEVITPDSVVDQTARELMEVAKDMTVETARKFMEGYKGGEVNRYKESWEYYSNMGRANVDFEKAQRLDGVYYNYISAEAAQAAIKSGFNDREFTVGVTDLSTTKKTYQERMMFRVMEGFAKEFGTEFIVVDDLDSANGYFIGDTNRIVISRNAEGGMLLRTAGHEAYHFIESNSAESAQALGDFVIDSLKKNGMDIEAQAAKLRRRYSADGAVSDAQIRAEIVADSMFEVLNSKEAINRFVRKNNPKKVQSVIDAIDKIVNSIKTSLARMGQKLDGSGKYVHPEIKALVDDYEALEEIRKQFMKGMESASASFAENKNKKSAEKAADDKKTFSFAASKDNELTTQVAEMERDGASREEIWKKLGLIRDASGVWVYEIDDSEMEIFPNGDARLRNEEGYKRMTELFEKGFINGELLTEAEQKEYSELHKKYNIKKKIAIDIEDFVVHDKLFEKYPVLRKAVFGFDDLQSRGIRGYYSKGTNEIVLDNSLKKEINKGQLGKTAIHEIQHALQYLDGRANGASTEYWEDELSAGRRINKYDRAIQETHDARMRIWNEMTPELQAKVTSIIQAQLAGDKETVSALEMELMKSEEDYEKFWDHDEYFREEYRLRANNPEMTAKELYFNTAGEIESRETASRLKMSAAERAEKTPDLGWERAVFADGAVTGYEYVGKTQDGIEVFETSVETKQLTYEKKLEKFEQNFYTVGSPHYLGEKVRFKVGNKTLFAEIDRHTQKENTGKINLGHLNQWDKAKLNIGADGDFILLIEDAYRSPNSKPEKNRDKKKNDAHKKTEFFEYHLKTVFIDNKAFDVVVNIRREASDKRYVYDVILRKNKELSQLGPQNIIRRPKVQSTRLSESSIQSIPKTSKKVKPEIQKSIKAEDDAPTAIDRYYAEAIRENRAFSQIFALMGDMYSTKMGEVYLDNADIRALSKKLLKEFGSKYDEAALTDELQIVFDYMANNRGNIDVDGCMKIFMQSAQNILEKSKMKNDELWQQYADTREFLREQNIYINPELKTEIESAYGDYKSFRSRLMGKMMHISTKDSGAATLDEVWGELNERAPEYFPKEVNDKDQPLYLTKFFESIAPKTVNRVDHYSLDMETESAILAARMFEEFGNIGRLKTTEQKIADLYRTKQFKLKSETQALRRKLKADAEKHKADTVEDYRKQLGDYRTAREMTEKRRRLRNEIDRSVAYVNRRLERETDKDHIPEKLKPLTRSFLRALPDNSEYFNPDRFASFVQEYDKLKSDFAEDDFEYMKARMNEFSDNVAGRSEAQPPKRRELDDVQLAMLRDIAAHVKYIVQNENRMFNENIKETAQQLSQKAHSELTAKGKSSVQGVPEHASKLSREAIRNRFDSFARKLVKPDYLFANLGSDTLEMLYKEMHKGENVESEMIRQAKTDLDEIRRRNNYDTRWKYQTVTVKSRDGELTITVEDAMALYATCKRNQGLGHILNGGFEIEFKTKKGWVKDRRVFTPDDIRLLKDSLSKDQLNYMNETVEYITKVIGEKRNETSMRMLGIKKYNEEFYFPIKTHENFNDTSVGVKKGVAKIENQSSAKRTTKNADNPVVIRGFSDTVVDHVFDSAMYCAYAAAIKDFARVYNYRERNEAEGLEIYTDSRYSIKEDVQRANGVNAIKEVEAFLQALDSGSMDKSALSLPAKFASKAKKAAVMANVSVVVQQPTSVFRAMLHVSPKYFATFATKADIEEMKKYNPGCTFKKEIGYFDINVGSTATDYMKEHTVDKAVKKDWGARDRARNLAEKALPKIDEVSGWAASKADEMTWGAIWNACKKQTAAQNSDLSPEQVKSKATELFQEVISKTQVYDSVFTKNAAMRSKSGFDTMIMQFMSEPMTTLNMLADAVVNAKNGRQPKSRCAAAFACYITSLVANSAVKSLVYSLRDDDEEKSFVEKFIGNFAEGAITDPFGMIPYLKEVLSLVQGYDFERIDTKALEELLNAYQSVMNDDKTPWDKVMAVMKAVGYATGVPFHTVMRDGKAVVDAGKKVYDAVANGKALEPTTGEGIKQTLAETFDWVPGVNPANKYEQLYNALIEGDTAHYNKVYNNLIEDGKEENAINNELSKRLVKDGRIAEIYNKMLNGEAAEAAEVIGKLKDQGFNQETIDKALSKHENSIKDEIVADSRAQEAAVAKSNMDYDSYEKLISDMVDDGYPEALVIKAVKSLAPKDEEYDEFSPAETDPLYSNEDLEIALASGNMENVEAVYSEYEAAHGAEKAAETMRKATRAAYKSGLISDSQAEAYLRKYKTEDTDDNDIFWAMEELRGGDGYKKYNKLCKAIESGASVEDVLDYYTEHGVEMKTVKSNITTNFKPKLIEAQGTEEFDELYDNVIDAFVATGDSEIEAKKKVNKWFEN